MSQFRQRRRATAHRRAARVAEAFSDRAPLRAAMLYRWVDVGDGAPARVMPDEERDQLRDPLAVTFFHKGRYPLTVAEVMTGLDEAGVAPDVQSFLVGEAGQLPPEDDLARDFRFAVVRGTASHADLMISTDATDHGVDAFLQVAAWDEAAGHFNFYMRVDEAWVWTGNSYTALCPESRGRSCFDSHVNGSVVMKELKEPWLHWHSEAASIDLHPDDPVTSSPLLPFLEGAEVLEKVVRGAVERWTGARFAALRAAGTIEHPDWLLRQLCTTTTVNLASSRTEYSNLDATETFQPPLGFWLNVEALVDLLGIEPDFAVPEVSARHYRDCLRQYGFALTDGDFFRAGDSHFVCAVPEPAYEDLHVVAHMIRDKLLSERFVACVLMVDFANPVFSARRARLLEGLPTTAVPYGSGWGERLAESIARSPGEPAAEFAENWAVPEGQWRTRFAERINTHMAGVTARLSTVEGVDAIVRLAESRRREFRPLKLAEFSLTLPRTTIAEDAPLLEMAEGGTVRPKQS